jgi:phage gpG-like protein
MAWGVVLRVAARFAARPAARSMMGDVAGSLLSMGGGSAQGGQPNTNLSITASVDASAALAANKIRLDRLSDMSPVWEYIADDFATKEGTVFKRGGANSSYNKWAPLKQSTIDRKKSSPYKKNASRILVRSGNLRASLTQRGHSNFIFRSNRRYMEIGTSVKYAGIHDAGNPQGGLPQRTLIRIPDTARKKWNSAILRHLVNTKSFGFERLG